MTDRVTRENQRYTATRFTSPVNRQSRPFVPPLAGNGRLGQRGERWAKQKEPPAGGTVLNLMMNFPFFFAEFTAQALSRSARSS